MQLWDAVLTADLQSDLANENAGKEWLFAQPWWKQGGRPEHWTEKARRHWVRNILALRSIAERMKPGTRFRKDAGHKIADQVVREYFDMMRLHPAVEGNALLSAKTYRGITHRCMSDRTESGAFLDYLFGSDLEFFWQCVFLSVFEDVRPVCVGCGKLLPATTRTGRASRLTNCTACRVAAWAKGKKPTELRKLWKRKKRAQRKAIKEN